MFFLSKFRQGYECLRYDENVELVVRTEPEARAGMVTGASKGAFDIFRRLHVAGAYYVGAFRGDDNYRMVCQDLGENVCPLSASGESILAQLVDKSGGRSGARKNLEKPPLPHPIAGAFRYIRDQHDRSTLQQRRPLGKGQVGRRAARLIKIDSLRGVDACDCDMDLPRNRHFVNAAAPLNEVLMHFTGRAGGCVDYAAVLIEQDVDDKF